MYIFFLLSPLQVFIFPSFLFLSLSPTSHLLLHVLFLFFFIKFILFSFLNPFSLSSSISTVQPGNAIFSLPIKCLPITPSLFQHPISVFPIHVTADSLFRPFWLLLLIFSVFSGSLNFCLLVFSWNSISSSNSSVIIHRLNFCVYKFPNPFLLLSFKPPKLFEFFGYNSSFFLFFLFINFQIISYYFLSNIQNTSNSHGLGLSSLSLSLLLNFISQKKKNNKPKKSQQRPIFGFLGF